MTTGIECPQCHRKDATLEHLATCGMKEQWDKHPETVNAVIPLPDHTTEWLAENVRLRDELAASNNAREKAEHERDEAQGALRELSTDMSLGLTMVASYINAERYDDAIAITDELRRRSSIRRPR